MRPRSGAAAGAVVWGVLVVGLYSISTASPPLLAGWWIGQTIELALAGALLGGAAGGASLKRIWWMVAAAVVILFVATVVLRSLGLGTAMKVVGG